MTTNTPARSSAGNTLVNILFVGFVLMIGYLLWPFVVRQYYGTPVPVEQAPATAPALIVATPVRVPAPVYVQAPAPVIVQQVPAGEAPQPVQVQPQPAPVQAENAPAAEPAPRPLIIVHQVSADGQHQVITGSGACKVTHVAARCSK